MNRSWRAFSHHPVTITVVVLAPIAAAMMGVFLAYNAGLAWLMPQVQQALSGLFIGWLFLAAVGALVLGTTAIVWPHSFRAALRWGAPLLPLLGALLLAVFAVLLPPRRRRQWLGEVVTTFMDRRAYGLTFYGVLGSFLWNWPAAMAGAWSSYLNGPPKQLRLDKDLAPPTGGHWRRHRTEWIIGLVVGIVFGALFAIPGAVGYEALTEWLHHEGYAWWFEAAPAEH